MKAVILAGGYATRLRPISYTLPKLLFPVLGKPMIYWTLDLLKKHGVDEVVLAVNYLADELRVEVGDKYEGMRVKYSLEDQPLGTGGPIKLAAQTTSLKRSFIAMNGDVIANINFHEMLEHHRTHNARVTDALYEVRDPSRFGVVQLDSAQRIVRFVEKPDLRHAPSRLINAGIYIIDPEVVKMIPARRRVSLEREIFPVLAKRRQLNGFPLKGKWFDIGNLSDYRKANFALLRVKQRRSELAKKGKKVGNGKLKQPFFLGEGSRVLTAARVGPNVVIGRDCLIQQGAKVSNSILFDRISVGKKSAISGAIIASNVRIENRVNIEPGVIISPNVMVDERVRIGRKAVIHSHKEITMNVEPGVHVM